MSTTAQVQKYIQRRRRGEPFTSSSLMEYGTRASVDQALSRLTTSGKIVRVTRGVYVRPEQNRYVRVVLPEPLKIAKAIAKESKELVQVNNAEAARKFGFTTQVPAQPVFFTTGRSRQFKMGELKINLRHVSRRKIPLPNSEVGLAIQALWHVGKENATTQHIEIIKSKLRPGEFNKFMRSKKEMPIWMRNIVSEYEKES